MVSNPDTRLTYTVVEVARLLGLSRMSAYSAVTCKEIPSIRVGRRLLIPRAAIERMLAGAENPRGATTT